MMFRGEKGGNINEEIIKREMKKMREGMGMKDSEKKNEMRKYFEKNIMGRGGDLRKIKEIMGNERM